MKKFKKTTADRTACTRLLPAESLRTRFNSAALPRLLNYLAAACWLFLVFCSQAAAQATANKIVQENQLPGSPASEWDIAGAGDLSMQGFATDISVNIGGTVFFKVDADVPYAIDIYRLGYYGGLGARKVNASPIVVTTPQIQPEPFRDPATGLVDCGNWAVSAQWQVPSSAVSGVYIARLRRLSDGQGGSHIVFVVRDDTGNSDLLFQTSDATWQAYNGYGGYSLYTGTTNFPNGHGVKVSYNRPFLTRSGNAGGGAEEDWVFNAEYPMIRWLERNGYNVSYFTNVDADRRGALIQQHKVFLSVGHDEYWSAQHRANVEAARDAGVHLAFFSGNEVYWKTRWEPSTVGTATNYRTLVCYKEGTQGERTCGGKCDPIPDIWTGLWRDGCSFQGADGCNPENALTGQISWAEASTSIVVPGTFRNHRFWRNTAVASQPAGSSQTLSDGSLGYEWDYEQNNGRYPAGRVVLSQTTVDGKTHRLSLYRHSSGALVFGAGTVQWSWGLDDQHDRGTSEQDPRMQQATVNLLADMGVQPQSLQANLTAAVRVTDNQAPVTAVAAPANNGSVSTGVPVTISGTATEAGGGIIAGVEVSVDGGTTWLPASGTNTWSLVWVPPTAGTYTIRSRAWDDMGNLETQSTSANTIQVSNTTTPPLPPTYPAPAPIDGPGGPILLVTSDNNPFTKFYAEILRAEGFNAFINKDISQLSETDITNAKVIILGEMPLTDQQVSAFTLWVQNGGTLVAMRPDSKLASLMGITPASGSLANRYLMINTQTEQGKGLVNQTIQYHGTASLFTLDGAISLATLYSNATTASAYPAVTFRSVGTNGGQAIAFAYDLAKSVVYTRQGNPEWSGQDRDDLSPVRSNDLFYGQAANDPQPDWIDLNKVAIPQADEQQRLLTNIINRRNSDKMPLPRFWFLPRGLKAAVVMTGDDHANGATADRFNQYLELSGTQNTPADVADWKAIRGSSYIYPNTPLTPQQVANYQAAGFEIGLHLNTECANWTDLSWVNYWNTQLQDLTNKYPNLNPVTTNRTHCIAWSNWASQARLSANNGVRLDVNYYYWPGPWLQNRAGMFTGSGMPMRFADLDGSIIDCFQVVTQMTDESDQSYPEFIEQLLNKALGSEGYYGVFCANMHTDAPFSPGSDAIINSAISRNVPVISARQMLTWLDSRNSAGFSNFTWNNNILGFTITASEFARGLESMLPMNIGENRIKTLSYNGANLSFRLETIKGMEYAFFPARTGVYQAVYELNPCTTLTAVLNAAPANCENKAIELKISSTNAQAPFTIKVNNTTYTGVSINQVFATLPSEQSIWNNATTPVQPNNNDGQAIEVGVKFTATQNGIISGIRFYKGTENTGTHTGKLWSSNGALLASAQFINETASGWQEVRFATPVNITANTTYIASYFSANGGYAYNPAFFVNPVLSGVLMASQSSGENRNGVYKYGGGFPIESYNDANYWVDVLFKPSTYTFELTSLIDAAGCSRNETISTATLDQSDLNKGLQTFYRDNDGDGFGNKNQKLESCTVPSGYVSDDTDCDDSDNQVYPGAPEVCDGKDNNCNGSIDEGVLTTYYRDVDGDTYGNAAQSIEACTAPEGYVARSGDCNDNSAAIRPGAEEICDGIDNDCNGSVDENCPVNTYYRDADGDGFGNNALPATGTVAPQGYVVSNTDCNDANPNIKPGAVELCDGVDNDCDGQVDEGVQTTYYRDADQDGYGSSSEIVQACSAPNGFVANNDDCDDTNAAIHPGATEICDNKDNDCDGQTDETCTVRTYFRDQDGDGFGNAAQTVQGTVKPAGYVTESGDCNDNNGNINPDAQEVCDNVDNNCNGQVDEGVQTTYYQDLDADGFGSDISIQACSKPTGYVLVNGDCNDNNTLVNPGATELCDGFDNNCNGQTDEGCTLITYYRDEDGDGYGNTNNTITSTLPQPPAGYTGNDGDCVDNDPAINPGATEICDNKDNNCNGQTDEGVKTTFYRDRDGDGFGDDATTTQACTAPQGYVAQGGDCLDSDNAIYPNAPEVCDGKDNDCDDAVDEGVQTTYFRDVDNDGYGGTTTIQACSKPTGYAATGGDCNDNNSNIHPGAAEACDGLDNDCDGQTDETCSTNTYYRDLDGDGFGNIAAPRYATFITPGYVVNNTDCDDNDANIKPGAVEICDSKDNDCDGLVDEGVQTVYYRDADNDGYGTDDTAMACTKPQGYALVNGDCNDDNAGIKPGATETCDGVDNDCDNLVDEDCAIITYFKDVDGDGYGDPETALAQTFKPEGYIATGGDCNDNNAAIHPNAAELCDGVDNDCDGLTDEELLTTYYLDGDGDGYGGTLSTQACSKPQGYALVSGDCNDNNANINPGATEVCDDVDNDCDGQVDEGLKLTWYRDQDGDGYGTGTTVQACSKPQGYAASGGDCNDNSAAVNPGATEICDGIDNNCNGSIDENCAIVTYYFDLDGDTYGNPGTATQSAYTLPGYVTRAGDCDDGNSNVNPGATELCDGIDNNCNGQTDEGLNFVTYYRDQDGDTYGTTAVSLLACTAPQGYATRGGDCNDNNASINPGATEVCDNVDNDCDGQVDEGVKLTFYRDADGDTYGDPNQTIQACSAPPGYVNRTGDCNDNNATVRTGAVEACDGIDNDCDGQVDEGCQRIASFTLVNAATDKDIGTLTTGQTINLATISGKSVTIRVNTTPTQVGSVIMNLTGTQVYNRTENSLPYALYGGTTTNYAGWTPAAGTYSLRARPYTQTNGRGTAGVASTIGFTVIDNPLPVANAGADITLTLPTNSTVLNGSGTDANGTIAKYAWTQVSGPATATFSSSTVAKPTVSALVVGTYVFSLVVTDNQAGVSNADQVSVTVNNSITPPTLSNLTLINSSNNTSLGTLVNGQQINLNTTPEINIRANRSSGTIGSVRFDLNNTVGYRVENQSPYAIAGDASGVFADWNIAPGTYTVKATPFSGRDATGTAGPTITVTFTIIKPAVRSGIAPDITSSKGPAVDPDLKVTVQPNPASHHFVLNLRSSSDIPVNLLVTDAIGRVVEVRQRLPANGSLTLGHQYANGTYIAEFTQSSKKVPVKLVKAGQ